MTQETETVEPQDADDILRAKIRKAKKDDGQTWEAFAKAAGVANGTLTSWLSGNYNEGKRPTETVDKLGKYLDARAAKSGDASNDPGWVKTPTSERMWTILEDAQFSPDIVSISGNPGIGKTATLRQYREDRPNVWLLTMRPGVKSPHVMVSRLAEIMGVEERMSAKITDTIGIRVQGAGGLIVIDEAQHLSAPMLDELRYLHDEYGVGLAFSGNLALHGQLTGGKAGAARKPAYAQLYSRIGFRETFAKPTDADVAAILDAWGVKDAESRRLLQAIAKKAGALREMVKTIRTAARVAIGVSEPLGERHIRAAWAHRDPKED